MKRPLILLFLLMAGCTFNPPPLPVLEQPPGGVFNVGDSIVIQFDEPVVAESLAIRVWPVGPEDITSENEFVDGLKPIVKSCKLAETPCGELQLTLNEARRELEISFEGKSFQEIKVPWRLEVLPGLADDSGSETYASYYFDFQFAPSDALVFGEEVPFDDGKFILLGIIEEPLPAILNLLCDIQAHDDGAVRLACGNASPIEGAAKNTANPDELYIDETAGGFALFASGAIIQDGEERYLQTEPFPVSLYVGPIHIILEDVRLSGVVYAESPPRGGLPLDEDADWIEGTISYGKIVLDSGGSEPFEYPPGNTTFFANRIPEGHIPGGIPEICGDLCGLVEAQCTPPDAFPGEEFCEILEGE